MQNRKPLVSIMIPNYNHGIYLDQCIQSTLNQTYENIEIVVLDNCSNDNSTEIIKKYTKDGVKLLKNICNIRGDTYKVISELTGGKYKMLLCADDYILPDFVSKSISVMEEYPNVGYVHCEKDNVTENDDIISLDPFYNCSFIVSGEEVMPIYLLTPVASPSNGIFRTTSFEMIGGYNSLMPHVNADRTLWYYLSTISDYAYIREKLGRYRISTNSQSSLSVLNFSGPICDYLSIKNLIDYAELKGYKKVTERKEEAYKKISSFCLSYVSSMLKNKNFNRAKEYLIFCKLFDSDIEKDERYLKLKKMHETKIIDTEYFKNETNESTSRKRSYEPPNGYKKINV